MKDRVQGVGIGGVWAEGEGKPHVAFAQRWLVWDGFAWIGRIACRKKDLFAVAVVVAVGVVFSAFALFSQFDGPVSTCRWWNVFHQAQVQVEGIGVNGGDRASRCEYVVRAVGQGLEEHLLLGIFGQLDFIGAEASIVGTGLAIAELVS